MATKETTILEFAKFHEVEVYVISSHFIDLLENGLIKKVGTNADPSKKIFLNMGGFDLIVSNKGLDLDNQYKITVKGRSAFENLTKESA